MGTHASRPPARAGTGTVTDTDTGTDTDAAHDVVIIGAGMAGLYMAHTLRRAHPMARVVVLEQAPRAGGRAGMARFRDARVVIGAGVCREGDALLRALLQEVEG